MTNPIYPTKVTAESVNDGNKEGARNEYLDDLSFTQSIAAEVSGPDISGAPDGVHEAPAATKVTSLNSDLGVDSPTQHRIAQCFMREQVFNTPNGARTGARADDNANGHGVIAAMCPVCGAVHTTLGYCPKMADASLGAGLQDSKGSTGIPDLHGDPYNLDINDPNSDPYSVAAHPWTLSRDGLYRPVAPASAEAREAMRIREVQLNEMWVHKNIARS
jgi:hypothetical protein